MLHKYNLVGTILVSLMVLVFVSCSDNHKNSDSNREFIRLKGKTFQLADSTFIPLILNYTTTFVKDSLGRLVLGPFVDYELNQKFENYSKESIEDQLLGHMKIIKEMGFNTVRVCLDNDFILDVEKNKFLLRYYIDDTNVERFDVVENSRLILDAIDDFVAIVHSQDFHLIFLLVPPFCKKVETFTQHLLQRFSDDPTIMAYDFFNEPLYFHKKYLGDNHLNKNFPVEVTNQWLSMMRRYAPNQLFTIAFAEPIDVFHWDPGLIPIDFVQIHSYHPLRFPNEVYWFTHYVDKPIIIGETSLPAENDSVYYEEQRQFMVESYKLARKWGVSGFGWWTFQEVEHGDFEHSYTGIINRKGETYSQDSKHKMMGTFKPAVYEVKRLESLFQNDTSSYKRPINYFNMLGYDNYLTRGKVVDSKNNPIEGALIRGWTKYWKVGMNTYTDENGEFTLYSNDIPMYFSISAVGKRLVRILDTVLTYRPVTTAALDEASFPYRSLEYHSISFIPFLKYRIKNKDEKIKTDRYIFNFDSTRFFNYKMEANLGVIQLEGI